MPGQIRENFKYLFKVTQNVETHYQMWRDHAISQSITTVNDVIKTFDRHLTGIFNAITTGTSSAKHENMNGKIQPVMAKARGFLNFDRLRINILFYFGNLNINPQKI